MPRSIRRVPEVAERETRRSRRAFVGCGETLQHLEGKRGAGGSRREITSGCWSETEEESWGGDGSRADDRDRWPALLLHISLHDACDSAALPRIREEAEGEWHP